MTKKKKKKSFLKIKKKTSYTDEELAEIASKPIVTKNGDIIRVLSRLCPRCKQNKPLTIRFWSRDRTKPSGFKSHCLECTRKANSTYYYRVTKINQSKEDVVDLSLPTQISEE